MKTCLLRITCYRRFYFPGGFDGTSNVLAGKMFNIPVKGTHAHSFVTSFSSLDDVRAGGGGGGGELLRGAVGWRARLAPVLDVSPEEASDGELAALVSYAQAFPSGFLALVDTYDVKRYNFQGLPSRHRQRTNGHSGYNSNCGSNGRRTQNCSILSTCGRSTVERTLR